MLKALLVGCAAYLRGNITATTRCICDLNAPELALFGDCYHCPPSWWDWRWRLKEKHEYR